MIDGIERNRQTIKALFSGYDRPIKSEYHEKDSIADIYTTLTGYNVEKVDIGWWIPELDKHFYSIADMRKWMKENKKSVSSSRKAIKSAKYDSDTTNLRQMNIPQDLPMWLIDKYYEEERRNNNSIWHWFLQEIRRNPWKSGFTGDSLYTTDGNIDLVIGPNQARFKVYKVTPKSERIAKNLTYAYYGKDDIENIDVVIQKKDIDNFISDLLHNYIW